MNHTFHIPVLGLAYSIDTPLKVARYGISSVVSIVDDFAVETTRKFHLEKANQKYVPINKEEPDYRAKRITAYLNMMNGMVNQQFEKLKTDDFFPKSDLTRYFELLPDHSSLIVDYLLMLKTDDYFARKELQQDLRNRMIVGEIDVNIMAKVDKANFATNGEALDDSYNDALAALRGFALSDLSSSVVLSAGMNPRLYSYLESFPDFLPDEQYCLKKKVILKVSDFRSAFIQAKFLAKKCIWVSEFRIESGLNCGGHAFATEGYLLGPILEEFKNKRQELATELFSIYQQALNLKEIQLKEAPAFKITVQGGIGTAEEHDFLLQHYQLDAIGWGSPFLLVPETTNVDEDTLQDLASANEDDFYISGSSPLGIPFNNFRKSSAEKQRLERIAKGRPGSPCTKKFLVSNTEFTPQPICLASREYQNLKIKALKNASLSAEEYQKAFDEVTEKICLCEGLVNSFNLKYQLQKPKQNTAVAICPGPNIAYFKGVYSLDEMVNHIYGKIDLLKGINRPNLFINEFNLYLEHLKKDIGMHLLQMSQKKAKSLMNFKEQLLNGLSYYRDLFPKLKYFNANSIALVMNQLTDLEGQLEAIPLTINNTLDLAQK